MIFLRILYLAAFFVCAAGRISIAVELPVCSNRVVNEVTSRVGCTMGDYKCWFTQKGFCTDYIQQMTKGGWYGKENTWSPIRPENVRKGDIAFFNSRVHYSYVTSVVKNKRGKPVAVDVSEYNFGTCWVDEQFMVTDKYKLLNERSGIPLRAVDGGFLRYNTNN